MTKTDSFNLNVNSDCIPHPADTNGKCDIDTDEITAYASCWKNNCNWNTNGEIPMTYLTRGGYLWKSGGIYRSNEGFTCPPDSPVDCWEAGWI